MERALGPTALQVVTSGVLFPEIASYLRGVPVWTVEYEHNLGPQGSEMTCHERAKVSMGTAGLLPRLAIQHRDLPTLVRLYTLSTQPQFRRKGKFWFTSAPHEAAVSGYLEGLVWLMDNTKEKLRSNTINMAAQHGRADVLRWLLANGSTYGSTESSITAHTMERVAANGHLDVLRLLIAEKAFVGSLELALMQAAINGHVEAVRYLSTEHGMVVDDMETVVRACAANGHLHVLEWLSDGFSKAAGFDAVAHGHLHVAQFLWEKAQRSRNQSSASASDGVDSDLQRGMRQAIPLAIRAGNAAMVAWLLTILRDSFPPRAMAIAATHGHLAVVQVLDQAGVCSQQDLENALAVATNAHHIEIEECLREALANNADNAKSIEENRADEEPRGEA